MKKLMLSTALVASFTLPAVAQVGLFLDQPTSGAIHASELIGARIYASEAAVDADEYSGVQQDWTDIGEINDVVLTREGSVEAVLVDIGGFLGIGERQAAIDMSSLRFVSEAGTPDNPDDWFLVMNADRATIEAAPEWKRSMDGATADPVTTEPATGAATDTATATPEATTETAPKADVTADATATTTDSPMARDGYTPVASADLTSEMLTGATVYDANDRSVGEVADLVVTEDGKVTAAIIDVGGFLGMGEKPVEVKLDDVNILRQNDGNDLRIYIAMTKEELEAMPSYTN